MVEDGLHWYALHVKPHKERAVYEQLLSRDIIAYYPHLQVKPKNPRSRKERPFFPGYLFTRVNLTEIGADALSWIPGSHRLVTYGDVPTVVPESLIKQIKEHVTAKQQSLSPLHKFKKGDIIRIVNGSFTGYEAIFDTHLTGKDRVQVLLSFLSNYPQPIRLDADAIIKMN